MTVPMSDNSDSYPWNGVFQTREELDQYFSGDRITCLICGGQFLVLASHIKTAHGVQVDEYKQRYGIPWNRGLTSTGSRKKYSDLMKGKKAAGKRNGVNLRRIARSVNGELIAECRMRRERAFLRF